MRPSTAGRASNSLRRQTLATAAAHSPLRHAAHLLTASLSTIPASSTAASHAPPYLRSVPGSVSIYVQCKAGCHASSVYSVSDSSLHVRIGARAVEGAANAELIRFLASILGVSKSSVSINSGSSSSRKLVSVRTGLTWQQVQAALSGSVS